MGKKERTGSLRWIQKIGYGIGDAGGNFSCTFIASFFLLYCTNTLGLSATVIGTLLMLSKLLDGVSDVFMGRIIDVTHSRMGKARFWYFVSILPLAVFTFLIFNVPGTFTENTQYAYIFIVYTLIGAVFYTMNNIAYSTLTALCTRDPKERVQMGSYRFIFAIVAVLIISSVTSPLVDAFGGGQQGWRMVGLIYMIVCIVLLMIPVLAVKELPENDSETVLKRKDDKENKLSFIQNIIVLLKNKYFILILMLYLSTYLASGVTQGLGIYFATYKLNNASYLGILSLASFLPIVVVLPFVPALTAKYGMRTASLLGSVFGIAGCIPVVIGGLTGNFPLLLAGMIMIAAGRAPQTGALNALNAEVGEYGKLKTGYNVTGSIYACSSVGVKVGTGLGTALCGFILDMGGFDGRAAKQTASAVAAISSSYLIAAVALPLISFIILYFLKVEKENKELRKIANK